MGIMSLFKEKTKSKTDSNINKRLTIDATHKKKMQSFENNKKIIENMEKLLIKKTNDFQLLEKMSKMDMSDHELETYFELKTDISELTNNIENLKTNSDKNSYLLDTGHILFDYYEKLNNLNY